MTDRLERPALKARMRMVMIWKCMAAFKMEKEKMSSVRSLLQYRKKLEKIFGLPDAQGPVRVLGMSRTGSYSG